MSKVRIRCSIPNGLHLRVFETRDAEFGTKDVIEKDHRIVPQGESEVDSTFFEEWEKQHADNSLLKLGMIERVKIDDEAETAGKQPKPPGSGDA